MQWQQQQRWGMVVRNTGGNKYETTAREIQNYQIGAFCSKWRMTFRKVTPAALKVNVKKFWQVLLVPWHVWAPIWVHFAPWWSIFPVKNRFSHIFPAPGGSPFLTVILTVKLARLPAAQFKNRQYLSVFLGICQMYFSYSVICISLICIKIIESSTAIWWWKQSSSSNFPRRCKNCQYLSIFPI